MKSTFSIIFYLKRQVVKKDGTVPVMEIVSDNKSEPALPVFGLMEARIYKGEYTSAEMIVLKSLDIHYKPMASIPFHLL